MATNFHMKCLSQILKGAVVVTRCQNEADVKCQMDIDSQISLTEQAISLIAPAFLQVRSGEIHLNFYLCLIPAGGHDNCSFQGLIIAEAELWPL